MLGGSTAALFAAMSVGGAQAQGGGDIEQVVVSASRVTIAGYSQPTPVTVVGAAQLEKDAYANITDAVRNLPQVNAPQASFGIENGGASQGSEGENILNLRNLGVIRTLILFDSQRVVAANITGGVDVGVIPSAVISRVDVVTGGASAAWGSDAVAGVVNFVLNKNFTGFKATIQGSDDYRNTNRGLLMQGAWGQDIFGGRGHLVLAGDATMRPDATMGYRENWNRNSFFVSNPACNPACNGAPQLIVANDVGLASATTGGIITASPAVTAANSPSGAAVAANALRGIEFVGAGIPQLVNFGNLTLGTISNGGSLTGADGEKPWGLISAPNNVYTAFGFVRYKITDTIQASLQLNYGYFTGKDYAQSNLQTALTIKSDNAFIPASVRATIQSTGITSFTLGTVNGNNFNNYTQQGDGYFQQTAGDIAPATEINHRQMMRAVFTLEGTLGDNWSWNTYYEHSTVRYWAHILGDAIVANLNNAEDSVTVTTANRGASNLPLGSIVCRSTLTGAAFVNGGITADSGCIPLDVFGEGVASANAIRYVTGGQGRDFEHMQTNQDVVEGSMQGTLPWQLPAGPVAVAFGAGYRKEAGVNHATQLGLQAGYAIANFSNYPSSSYNVMEGFGEVDGAILKNTFVDSLDFSMAGRMTSYSTSGLVETWKLGLTSQINEDVKLRTTWSVDIRSPSLTELFNPASINTGSIKDPKTGISNSGITNVTGNANLVPEVARTISGGVVLTPHWIDGFSMSLDWYNINLTGEIINISSGLILNTCTININDPLCTHLVFNGAPGVAGPALSGINNSPLNLASLRTSGLDVQANYTMDFWDGTLAWQAVANYVDEITQTQFGTPTDDYAGVMGANQPNITSGSPKWKGILSADYTTGPYSVTVQGRWFGTGIMNNSANQGNLSTAATANLQSINELPFTAYLDLRASYKWNDNITFYGAVDNATDVPPPLLPQTSAGVPPSIPAQSLTYDLLGRTMRLGIRFSY
jgi:outer membrane receptor protein involved in Fe transport